MIHENHGYQDYPLNLPIQSPSLWIYHGEWISWIIMDNNEDWWLVVHVCWWHRKSHSITIKQWSSVIPIYQPPHLKGEEYWLIIPVCCNGVGSWQTTKDMFSQKFHPWGPCQGTQLMVAPRSDAGWSQRWEDPGGSDQDGGDAQRTSREWCGVTWFVSNIRHQWWFMFIMS